MCFECARILSCPAIRRVKTGEIEEMQIDQDRCIKCGVCQRFCPEATMLLHEDRVIVDLRYCKGCGICANECPVDCINMVRVEV